MHQSDSADVQLDLSDIQGIVLRGYMMPALRHHVLRIEDPSNARSFIGDLVSGGSALPQVTTSEEWAAKPDVCLNLGLSYAGLQALEVPHESLTTFPSEFVEGPVTRADRLGDVGASAPEHWKGGLAEDGVHVVATLFAVGAGQLDAASLRLRERWSSDGGVSEVSHHDGHVFPENFAQPTRLLLHFGYSDGFSQPRVEGGPAQGLPDPLPRAPAGEFILGYESQFPGLTYRVPQPSELGLNGSFGVLRILEQDVAGFETFLHRAAADTGLDEETVAAKLCGRWRNGVPLVLSPDTASPPEPFPLERYNDFDYIESDSGAWPDDRRGYTCPVGAHIRRVNPRSQPVAGGGGHLHRLIRRGLPYGRPYDPDNPDDEERGLVGFFIGVSIADQFEFIMSRWIDDGLFAAGLGRTKDPLVGNNDPTDSRFVIPVANGDPQVITGFSSFVTTRGTMYCFIPSLTALRWLADMDGAA